MKTRFAYELIVGIIVLIAMVIFGGPGSAAMVLLAAHLFVGKKKADEREAQLFNKVGNITAGTTLLACVIIYFASDVVVNGYLIGDNWLPLAATAFIIAHGGVGLLVLKKG